MDREFGAERAVAVVEPSLVARPPVDRGVDRLVGPVAVPGPLSQVLLLAPGAVGDQPRVQRRLAVVPGVEVKDAGLWFSETGELVLA